MTEGSPWCLKKGYAWESDIEFTEQSGKIPGANPDNVSERAKKRGLDQIGTLGSGNHYLEIQKVDFDEQCDRPDYSYGSLRLQRVWPSDRHRLPSEFR